jgi:hypothetical protein
MLTWSRDTNRKQLLSTMTFGVLAGWLVVGIWSYRAMAHDTVAQAVVIQEHMSIYRELSKHLQHYFTTREYVQPHLVGHEIGGSEMSLSFEGPAIVVYLAPDCAFGPRHYDVLQELETHGVEVVGVYWGLEKERMRNHREEYGLTFPILTEASGSMAEGTPRFGTPFFILIEGSRIIGLRAGGLDRADAVLATWFNIPTSL